MSAELREKIAQIIDFTIADARLHDNLEDLSNESVNGLVALIPAGPTPPLVQLTPEPWTVGQTAFLESIIQYGPDRGKPNPLVEVKVTKVGKRWIYTDYGHHQQHGRFEAETGTIDRGDYSSSERFWRSQEERDEWWNLKTAWEALREAIRNCYGDPPIGLDWRSIARVTDDIKKVRDRESDPLS